MHVTFIFVKSKGDYECNEYYFFPDAKFPVLLLLSLSVLINQLFVLSMCLLSIFQGAIKQMS